jgi:sphingosine kinase
MDQVQDPILSDQISIDGTFTEVILTAAGVLKWSQGGSQRRLQIESRVLGFSIHGSRIQIKAVVEAGAEICCTSTKGTLHRKTFTFEPSSQLKLQLWTQKLRDYIDSLGRPKKLFVFLNPFGGSKSASRIFISDVKPLLDDANIEFTLQETKYQLHAKEIAITLDLSKYDGIICVSGDGVLVEVLNGLLERGDWEYAIKTPLGVVPAGTGNGMAKSLLDAVGSPCKVSNAVLAIIRGRIFFLIPCS